MGAGCTRGTAFRTWVAPAASAVNNAASPTPAAISDAVSLRTRAVEASRTATALAMFLVIAAGLQRRMRKR